eukprot:TRINITY_DN2921_c2_g1_i1.p1 TRINITY_DN2921_c2_g1~~TRINITY_DN2921_c2_g1_i1.p1  ORF type:complete len:259 (-),score=76.57 TRINITY_DN2921_c2_g1_i1:374-1150(-)
MDFIIAEENKTKEELLNIFKNSTLILPSINIGNIGQITMDLLISSLECRLIGYLDSHHILPFIGNDPFLLNQGQICLNLEIFYCEKYNLVLLQQRAAIKKNRNNQFSKCLFNWIEECVFKQIILLASSDASKRLDIQLSGSQQRFIISNCDHSKDISLQLINSGWQQLEKIDEQSFLFIPGSFADFFINQFSNNNKPLIVLICFCFEGDNRMDSIATANKLNLYLNFNNNNNNNNNKIQWRIPNSWQSLSSVAMEFYS